MPNDDGLIAAELKSFSPIGEILEEAAKHGYSVSMTTYLSPPEANAAAPVLDGANGASAAPSPEYVGRARGQVLADAIELVEMMQEAVGMPLPLSGVDTQLRDMGQDQATSRALDLSRNLRVLLVALRGEFESHQAIDLLNGCM